MGKLAKFFLVVREPRKKYENVTLKSRKKFSRENVETFWWSANRDKICQVVRESEKVENRWSRALGLPHRPIQVQSGAT